VIRPRTDRLFDRFRRTGDPRVLAKVFDATAPELWRVALHLCRDRHAAEDAVQGAFLSAIEARADWDAARPLLPWLLGHLANRVREQRRVSRRVPDPARFELPTSADPADVAAVREVSALCRDALQRLDEPYRTTLERHLVGGLAPHEIASELGVPAGTVRMRLHRGLDQLRQKLPASVLAGGAIASQVPPASLVAMREVVLGAVPGGAAVAGAGHVGSFLLGALVMNKLVFGVAASAVVLLSLWLAWPANAVAPLESAERSAVVAERGAAKASSPSPGDGAAKAAVERIAVVPPQPGDTNGRLRVVLRNAGNGEPEVGFGVEVRDPRPAVAGRGPAAPKRETGADGAATFDLPAGAVLVAVEAFRVLQGARSVMGAPRPAEVTAGRETELVIELPVQVEMDVVVVDPSGAPVPDARVVAFTERELVAPAGKEIGRTDAAGCFRRPFVESVVTVRAVAEGRAASPAVELRSGSRRTTLRLGAAEAIVDGVVFGLDGSPLRNAPVAVQSLPRRSDDMAPLVVRTDALGRFEVHHVQPGPCLVFAVRFLADGQMRLTSVEATAVAGARTTTEVRFGRGASLDIRLRRTDGTAVAGQQVWLHPQHRALEGAFALGTALAVTDANGEARVEGLMAGRYHLQVATRELLIDETIEFAEGEAKRFEPALGVVHDEDKITVRVVDAAQQPLAGWIVRLEPKSGRAGIEEATTDANGSATFQRLPEPAYRAQVFAAQNSFALLAEDVANGATVTLTAPDAANRSGVLHGRLVGKPEDLANVRVHVHRAENGPTSRERIEVACDAASGVFRAEHLQSGRYHVAVSSAGAQQKVLAFRMNLDVGAVPVDVGKITIGTGSLRVRATFADGRAVPGAVIAIGASGMFGPPPTGVDDGLVRDLPAAALDVLVWSETTVPIVTAAEIRSGETTELPVTATPGARVTVRFDDGLATLPSGMLRVRQAGAELFAVVVMPRDPLVRGFAPGSYELEFDDMRGKRSSVQCTVGSDLAAREVTLPSPK